MKNDAATCFKIINQTIVKDSNKLNVTLLCEIADVSRSGYYAWIKAEGKRKVREEKDRIDFELILTAYNKRDYTKIS